MIRLHKEISINKRWYHFSTALYHGSYEQVFWEAVDIALSVQDSIEWREPSIVTKIDYQSLAGTKMIWAPGKTLLRVRAEFNSVGGDFDGVFGDWPWEKLSMYLDKDEYKDQIARTGVDYVGAYIWGF